MINATEQSICDIIRQLYDQNGNGDYIAYFYGDMDKAQEFTDSMRRQLGPYAQKVEHRNSIVYITLNARGQLS